MFSKQCKLHLASVDQTPLEHMKIALKLPVDDFQITWLIYGVITIVALGWAASSFGPALFEMVGDNVQ